MERISYIEHKGKKILYIDFSNCNPDEMLELIPQCKEIIAKEPEKSLLTLTDVTDTHFDSKVVDALKEYTAHNKPYVKSGAIVGLTGLKETIYNVIMKFSGRSLAAFKDLEKAKDWLVEQ